MSEHHAAVTWKRETPDFKKETYNREHTWTFKDGLTLPASAAPEYKGKPKHADPEEAFTAAVAGCHMLTFLAIAAMQGYSVAEYTDEPVGILEKNAEGKLMMTKITLKPRATFDGEKQPSAEELKALHENAHKHCFIANSVRSEIVVDAG